MKWTKFVTRSHYWILGEKYGSFELSLGVCPTEPAWCSPLSGRLVLVEDKRLCKYVISDGSTTVGTRANNESTSFITLLQNLKFDQQKFAKSWMRSNYVNKYKP